MLSARCGDTLVVRSIKEVMARRFHYSAISEDFGGSPITRRAFE